MHPTQGKSGSSGGHPTEPHRTANHCIYTGQALAEPLLGEGRMKRPNSLPSLVFALAALCAAPGCGSTDDVPLEDADDVDVDDEGKADSTGTTSSWSKTLNEDNLNGLWKTTVAGSAVADATVIDSWPAVGILIHFQGRDYKVVRSDVTLTGAGVTLTLKPNKSGVSDDSIEGTIDGKAVRFVRDVTPKDPVTIQFPGDRPFRSFLTEVLAPAAQRDRESYKAMSAAQMLKWLDTAELYKSGSWPRTYMKGATLSEQFDNFRKVVYSLSSSNTSPHAIIHSARFVSAMQQNLKDPTKAALAMTTFSMYFSTAGGGALRLPITSDSLAYFITDRASRAEKIGLVAMATPLHGPLASTFGRLLLDLGAAAPTDDVTYARAMMELLAKSDARSAAMLSPAGRSALTDWYAVMAIEDYRGVSFGRPNLGWGYNATNVQFFGLVSRALARRDLKDDAGKTIIGQVIVGTELRPGDPSYADVLNGGDDLQEYSDMAKLKTLTTQYLRTARPDLVKAVETAFAGVVPTIELDSRARADIFHFISANLYDSKGRTANLKGAAADAAINAVVALIDALGRDTVALEAFILKAGITKSNVAAPKATGF